MIYPKNVEQDQVLHTGTTTIGIKCVDGVVLATDHRAVAGYYVAHKHTKKVYKLADHIATTIAGVVADAQKLIDYMIAECNLYRLSHLKSIPVKAAASLYAYYLFSRRWFPFMTQTIIGGYDETGPKIYTLDAVGSLIEEYTIAATGSGTPFALGVLEDAYDTNFTIKDAIPLAIRSVWSAIERDVGSGNGIDVAYVDKTGYNEVSEQVITTELKNWGKKL